MASVSNVNITGYDLDNKTITFEVTVTSLYTDTYSASADVYINGSPVGGSGLYFSGNGAPQSTFTRTFNLGSAGGGDEVQICVE